MDVVAAGSADGARGVVLDRPPTAPPTPGEQRLPHLPALDGIRGLGIPFVLLYHHGASVLGVSFGGGFMTVSMFFTLSGFLITRLLVQERQRTGTIGVRRFYGRRFRRLLPASLVVLLGVAVAWAVFPSATRNLSFGSFVATMTYWQNAYLIIEDHGYAQLFAERSPLQHTWSLSLEEQIYAVFPLIVLGLCALRGWHRRLAPALAGLAMLSYAAGAFWASGYGNERAYYATEARAGEFLLGAALAAWLASGTTTPRVVRFLRSPVAAGASFAVLAAEMAMWLVVDLDTGWFFPWAVALNSVLVCVLMAYAVAGSGCDGVLSNPALQAVGRVSYGVYLIHWPVFLFVDRDSTGLGSEPLFLVRVLVTALLTVALFRLVEDPVRTGRMWKGRRFTEACLLLAGAGLVVAPFARQPASTELVDPAAVDLQRQALASLPVLGPDAPTRSSVDPALPARVLVVGDSQSWIVGNGLKELWSPTSGVAVEPSPGVGCGAGEPGPIRYLGVELAGGHPGCREWRDALPAIVERFRPQVVVVVGGLADVSDHRIDGEWVTVGDPRYDAQLREDLRELAAVLTSGGARVVWTTHPPVRPPRPPGVDAFDEEDPARLARYNALLAELAAEHPAIELVDLDAFVRDRPGGPFDPAFRPDGAHFDLRAAPDLVEFFADAIRRAAADPA